MLPLVVVVVIGTWCLVVVVMGKVMMICIRMILDPGFFRGYV